LPLRRAAEAQDDAVCKIQKADIAQIPVLRRRLVDGVETGGLAMRGHHLDNGLGPVKGHQLADELGIFGRGAVLREGGDNQSQQDGGQGQTGTQTTSPMGIRLLLVRYG
jgi:hypothetical protein